MTGTKVKLHFENAPHGYKLNRDRTISKKSSSNNSSSSRSSSKRSSSRKRSSKKAPVLRFENAPHGYKLNQDKTISKQAPSTTPSKNNSFLEVARRRTGQSIDPVAQQRIEEQKTEGQFINQAATRGGLGRSYVVKSSDEGRYINVQTNQAGSVVGYEDTKTRQSIGRTTTKERLYQEAASERTVKELENKRLKEASIGRVDVAEKRGFFGNINKKLQMASESDNQLVRTAGIFGDVAVTGIKTGVYEPVKLVVTAPVQGFKKTKKGYTSIINNGFSQTFKDEWGRTKESISNLPLGISGALSSARPGQLIGGTAGLIYGPELLMGKLGKGRKLSSIEESSMTGKFKVSKKADEFVAVEKGSLMDMKIKPSKPEIRLSLSEKPIKTKPEKPVMDVSYSSDSIQGRNIHNEQVRARQWGLVKEGKLSMDEYFGMKAKPKPKQPVMKVDFDLSKPEGIKLHNEQVKSRQWGLVKEGKLSMDEYFGMKAKPKPKQPIVKIEIDKTPSQDPSKAFRELFGQKEKKSSFKIEGVGITIERTTPKKTFTKKISSTKDYFGKEESKGGTTTTGSMQLITKTETKPKQTISLSLLEEPKTKSALLSSGKDLLSLKELRAKAKLQGLRLFSQEQILIQEPKTATKQQTNQITIMKQELIKPSSKLSTGSLSVLNTQTKPSLITTKQEQTTIPILQPLTRTHTGQRQENKNITKTITDTTQKPITETITETRTITDLTIKPLTTNTMRFLPQERLKTYKMPELNHNNNKKKSFFDLIIGTKGTQNYKVISGLTLEQATMKGKNIVFGGAAASMKLKRSGGGKLTIGEEYKVSGMLGGRFQRGKKDQQRFVQKNKYRISSSGEKRDITMKGIAASKAGSSLLKSSKKTRKAHKLLSKGFSLREIRGLI